MLLGLYLLQVWEDEWRPLEMTRFFMHPTQTIVYKLQKQHTHFNIIVNSEGKSRDI